MSERLTVFVVAYAFLQFDSEKKTKNVSNHFCSKYCFSTVYIIIFLIHFRSYQTLCEQGAIDCIYEKKNTIATKASQQFCVVLGVLNNIQKSPKSDHKKVVMSKNS